MYLTHNTNITYNFSEERAYLERLNAMKISGHSRTTQTFYKFAKRNRFLNIQPSEAESQSLIVDSMITVLNRTYDTNWDFHYVPTISIRGKVVLEMYVTILFPEINITNQYDHEHLIKDLIVTFKVDFNHFKIEEIRGTRATMEFKEWSVGYLHSHLPSNKYLNFRNVFHLSSFCTAADINGVLIDINNNYQEELFESFLYNIQSMVEWESIEGRPHIRMQNIEVSQNKYTQPKLISNNKLKNYFNVFAQYVDPAFLNNLDFVYKEDRYNINQNKNLQDLMKTVLNQNPITSRELIIIEGDESYYGFDQESVINGNSVQDKFARSITSGVPEYPYFYIQDRKIEFKVEDFEGEQTVNIDNYKVHPKFLEYATNKLNEKLYIKSVRDHTIRKHSQSADA